MDLTLDPWNHFTELRNKSYTTKAVSKYLKQISLYILIQRLMIQLNIDGLHACEEITEAKERTMQKSYKEKSAWSSHKARNSASSHLSFITKLSFLIKLDNSLAIR